MMNTASGMLGSPRNRAAHDVDNPMDDDGFYRHIRFKAHRRTGAPTGGRARRRALRAKESAELARARRLDRF